MDESNPLSFSRRKWLQSAALAASIPTALWARSYVAADEDDEADDDDKRYRTKLETVLIGDHTTFAGLEPVVLEGVGLVRGLSGTGGDPAPSQYRSALMEDLKQRGYRNPNAILASPNTALVIVRAYLRPMLKIGDRLDIEIRVPESAQATSLVGGELMEVRLSDKAMVGGKMMVGRPHAIARGRVLTEGLGASTISEPALLKKGRVLGGAVVMKERDLSLFLKNDFRSVRNSQRISDVIGRRFHHFDEHGIKKPLATAKTDQRLILKVHPRYKDNFPRYLQVIRHLAFRETPVELRVRMNRLKHDLSIPETANSSALQLEGIGKDAIPILKTGLQAPTLECRFHSAVALAYLEDPTGLPALVEAAKKERAFRVFALAAISSLEEADAFVALRELLDEPSDETRYGAFRGLWTMDRKNPFIKGEKLGVRENDENDDNAYRLHALDTAGPPLVHATLRTHPEVVVFGSDQEFRVPMYASAGKHIVVTAQPGATTMSLSRFELGKPDKKVETSLRVADVIRAADELGASYPDILQLLADASKQKNLPVALALDKLPEAGRAYYRPSDGSKAAGPRGIRVGRPHSAPGMFPEVDDPEEASRRLQEDAREARSNRVDRPMLSVPSEPAADKADTESDSKSSRKPKKSWNWFLSKR